MTWLENLKTVVEQPPVESVVRHRLNAPLIAEAARLWIRPDDRVLDVTYGRGKFWDIFNPFILIPHDLALDGVDFRNLPEKDGSIDVVVFDPPYVSKGGRKTSGIVEMDDRYGLTTAARTPAELLAVNAEGMKEAARVLVPGGRLFVKCMDYVSSGKMVLGRHHAVATCLALGLEQVDEFVHHSGTGPQPQGRRQVHSRRSHSFLCIFQKPARRRPKIPERVA